MTTANDWNPPGLPGGILITLPSLPVHRLLSGPVVMPWVLPIALIVVGVSTVGLLGEIFTTALV